MIGVTLTDKKCRRPGQEQKGRCTEMRDPAHQEEAKRRGVEILGTEPRGHDKGSAVIEGHQDDDQASETIQGRDAAAGGGHGLSRRGLARR